MEIFYDVEQGSDEWHELRRGLPTASNFKVLMAKGDEKRGRSSYLYKLAGERLTGVCGEGYKNDTMERGNEMEPKIRRDYEMLTDQDTTLVGFILSRNGKAGCSPDSLVGEEGMMEAKSASPPVLIPMRLKALGDPKYFPPEHYAQCQGNLWIAEREWIDLIVWWPAMKPVVVRIERDEAYIDQLRDAVDLFDLELRRLVEKLK